MSSLEAPRLLLSETFSNFEELAEMVIGWNLDFHQISKNYAATTLDQIQIGEILFSHLTCGCYSTHSGKTPDKMYTFALPDGETPELRYMGQLVDRPALMVTSPGQEFALIVRPGYGICTYSVPEHIVEDYSEREFGCSFSRILLASNALFFIESGIASRWHDLPPSFSTSLI